MHAAKRMCKTFRVVVSLGRRSDLCKHLRAPILQQHFLAVCELMASRRPRFVVVSRKLTPLNALLSACHKHAAIKEQGHARSQHIVMPVLMLIPFSAGADPIVMQLRLLDACIMQLRCALLLSVSLLTVTTSLLSTSVSCHPGSASRGITRASHRHANASTWILIIMTGTFCLADRKEA